jgi:hypothetical protein
MENKPNPRDMYDFGKVVKPEDYSPDLKKLIENYCKEKGEKKETQK